jgi:ATP phosphoribosyltransferase
MSEPLLFAVPSKGRLKDQVEDWLADCGLPLRANGGSRGYTAALQGMDDIQVRLASAGDIAEALCAGDVHLGVTGEDLVREQGDRGDVRTRLLAPLGFGRADLVVAAPRSWIDVDTMADVEDVAHLYLARTGRRLRVATKYVVQTRAFFARHGIADYRIAESGGATEGAPAAGIAELVVDITTTGATLAANGLKPLADGLILRSQAHVAASLAMAWTPAQQDACRRLLSIAEARARGKAMVRMEWPLAHDRSARLALTEGGHGTLAPDEGGVLVERSRLFQACADLAAAAVGPVSVRHADYVFEMRCAAAEGLADALAARSRETLDKPPTRQVF